MAAATDSPDPFPDRDAEIIRLLAAADPDGLSGLITEYGPKVKWILKAQFKTLDEADIDEVLSLAAERVWRATYDPERGTLRAWFFVIARRCALLVLRRDRRQRRRFENTDWALDEIAVHCEPVVEIPSQPPQSGFVADLHTCIASLPRLQRTIIEADMLSPDVALAADLAARLNTTKNSIYASRSQARKSLKRKMLALGHSLAAEAPPATPP